MEWEEEVRGRRKQTHTDELKQPTTKNDTVRNQNANFNPLSDFLEQMKVIGTDRGTTIAKN